MYRHCIYCSADLGANDALEGFPVGRSVAFDGERGRLWAVCAHCARWNLAPIEERWEAVEAAERAFHDTRLRVQRENIGVAKPRDGTRLIRIGAALAGEVAAWRYGGELARRRRRHIARGHVSVAAAAVTAGAVFVALNPLSGAITGMGAFWAAGELYGTVEGWVERLMAARADRQPVHRLGTRDSPTHAPLVLLRAHLAAPTWRRTRRRASCWCASPRSRRRRTRWRRRPSRRRSRSAAPARGCCWDG